MFSMVMGDVGMTGVLWPGQGGPSSGPPLVGEPRRGRWRRVLERRNIISEYIWYIGKGRADGSVRHRDGVWVYIYRKYTLPTELRVVYFNVQMAGD
jgi:hypothetical protein